MSTASNPPRRTVFLVDDHPLVREWLSNLIGQQSDLVVCGEAGDRANALQMITATKPNVAIVDISLEGDSSGIELIKEIRMNAPTVAVVVLSMHEESLYVERALRAGARAYVMKREVAKNVLQAIRCVLEGNLYLSERLAIMMAERLVNGAVTISPVEQLSGRELEVFQLLGRGRTTRQIAENLNVSARTVQTFAARIKEKLKLANATELLREAVRWQDQKNSY